MIWTDGPAASYKEWQEDDFDGSLDEYLEVMQVTADMLSDIYETMTDLRERLRAADKSVDYLSSVDVEVFYNMSESVLKELKDQRAMIEQERKAASLS
jgi:hypothetical protein